MSEDWRERNKEREKDPVINCKRCEHYVPPEDNENALCLAWTTTFRRPRYLSANDAPWCQLRELKNGKKEAQATPHNEIR